MGCKGEKWIYLAHNMVQKQTLQTKVGYVQVPQKMGNFYTVSDCQLLKKEYQNPLVMTEISG
jgi:hypothetical protein